MQSFEFDANCLISIKQLQVYMGFSHYQSAQRLHKRIRNRISPQTEKRKLTVRELAQYQGIDPSTILITLRNPRSR